MNFLMLQKTFSLTELNHPRALLLAHELPKTTVSKNKTTIAKKKTTTFKKKTAVAKRRRNHVASSSEPEDSDEENYETMINDAASEDG